MSNGFLHFRGIIRRSSLWTALAVALAVVLTAAPAHDGWARVGGGGSFGSRGARTFSAPPSTSTAPRVSPLAPSPGFGASATRPGFLSGGFGRGLLGGLVGAGLFGMLFGNGFGGGLGGLSSIIGLILQLGLLYLLFRFIMGFFRGQPAFSGMTFGRAPSPGLNPVGGGSAGVGTRGVPIVITPPDYALFERRLGEIQSAYSAEDVEALRHLATPEMAGHFAGEITGNAQRGVINRLSEVKLLQGDLAEAWSEGATDYATVAMRFSLIDATVERNTGRVVGGSATAPQTVTELWTFVRPSGAGLEGWVLSAIQQG